MGKPKNAKRAEGTRYLQAHVPTKTLDEFDRITKRLGLSKQRTATIAVHMFNQLSDAERLGAYSETLELFDDGEG